MHEPAKFSPRPTGSTIVNRTLLGGMAVSIRSITDCTNSIARLRPRQPLSPTATHFAETATMRQVELVWQQSIELTFLTKCRRVQHANRHESAQTANSAAPRSAAARCSTPASLQAGRIPLSCKVASIYDQWPRCRTAISRRPRSRSSSCRWRTLSPAFSACAWASRRSC